MTFAKTIIVGEPSKYAIQKTVGGWIVVFYDAEMNSRNCDGGKVYPQKTNAYRRARALNKMRPSVFPY